MKAAGSVQRSVIRDFTEAHYRSLLQDAATSFRFESFG
jgi:hypothetical protein